VTQLAPGTTYKLRFDGSSTEFTTESATTDLLKMRGQLDSGFAYALAGIAPGARGLQVDADVPAAGTTLTYTADLGPAGGLVTQAVPNTSSAGAGRYVSARSSRPAGSTPTRSSRPPRRAASARGCGARRGCRSC